MPRLEGSLHGLKPDPSARADDQDLCHDVMLPVGPPGSPFMCAAGSCASRWGRLKLHFYAAHVRESHPVATLPRLRWETSVGMSAAAPMAALPLLLKLTVPTRLDQLYNRKRQRNRGWISPSAQSPATEVGYESQRRDAQGSRLGQSRHSCHRTREIDA